MLVIKLFNDFSQFVWDCIKVVLLTIALMTVASGVIVFACIGMIIACPIGAVRIVFPQEKK